MKIVGHIKMFNNQRSITGFMIKPIEDFNEVSHHMAETIFAHLAITKGLKLVSFKIKPLLPSLLASLSPSSFPIINKVIKWVGLLVLAALLLKQAEVVGPHLQRVLK